MEYVGSSLVNTWDFQTGNIRYSVETPISTQLALEIPIHQWDWPHHSLDAVRLTLPGTLLLPRGGLADGAGWSSKNQFCKQAAQGIGLPSDQMHEIDLKAGL